MWFQPLSARLPGACPHIPSATHPPIQIRIHQPYSSFHYVCWSPQLVSHLDPINLWGNRNVHLPPCRGAMPYTVFVSDGLHAGCFSSRSRQLQLWSRIQLLLPVSVLTRRFYYSLRIFVHAYQCDSSGCSWLLWLLHSVLRQRKTVWQDDWCRQCN